MMEGEGMPKVSLLIPTYNREKYLRMAVDSAVRQTYRDMEIVISDDCSTDGTISVPGLYDGTGNVVYCRNDSNVGFVENWNKAVALSTGKYIKIMGDDDVLEEDCIAAQAKILDAYPMVGIVCCDYFVTDEMGKIVKGNHYRLFDKDTEEKGREFIRNYLLGKRAVGWPTAILFRREDFERVGPFAVDTESAADIDLWCKILKTSDFYFVDRKLACNRQFEGNLSKQLKRSRAFYINVIREQMGGKMFAEGKKILFLTVGCINYDCTINFYKPLTRIFSDVLHYNYVEKIEEIGKVAVNAEIIEIVRKEKPDYVLMHMYQDQITIKTLDTLKSIGSKAIAWFSDDHWRFDSYSKVFAPHVYCSVTTDKQAYKKYEKAKFNAVMSQWASNPDYYKKLNLPLLHEVSFVGQNYGDRAGNIAFLKNAGISLAVFGKGFTDFVRFEDIVKIFNSTKINLNFSGSSKDNDIKQIKGRIFEITMCGGFLLTEYTPGIEEYFEIGKEIDCFVSLEEAVEKITYYLEHEEERKKMAETGYIRALKDHTWKDRIEDIFKAMETDKNENPPLQFQHRESYEIAFHGDNYLLALCDSILSKSEIFVETGAYYGHTLEYVARNFGHLQIYSCEPETKHFKETTKKLSPFKDKVILSQTVSPVFLYNLLQEDPTIVDKNTAFWLDAHSFGYDWPLREEIKFITKNFNKAYIFIDDFKVPGSPRFGYDKNKGGECSWETVYTDIFPDRDYTIHFPKYTEKTSTHHPLVGWVLLEFGHPSFEIPAFLREYTQSIPYSRLPSIKPLIENNHYRKKSGINILLTTSAAPSQTPFSTTEKRPPIGIGFLISSLKEVGHNVFFIDNYLQPNNFLETDYLQRNNIDYVGIYANTICYRDTLRMLHKLEWFRQINKWKGKIIVGGPHTTVSVNTIPNFVDFVVQGEGEQAIVDIIAGKTKDRIIKSPRIAVLDNLPSPAWDYFVGLPYDWGGTFFTEKPVFVINSSRGCPFRCTYCSVGSIWGKKYTCFSADRVVSDIEYLIKNYGAKGIYFREDNFTLDEKRLTKFCNLLIDKNIRIPWACESRVSSVNSENIKLMKKAGVCGFYFGVESGSQRVLDFVKKDITIEQTRNAFRLCHEYGIKSAASIIVGIPTETEKELNQTLLLVDEIKPTVTWFNVFTGIPNSELCKYTVENNLHRFIDDRGLVYLKDHDKLAARFYGTNWDANIPASIPTVSVVMSVYNEGKYLKEAIQSILQQTYQDFEFIIVNDGSTDKTSEILQNLNNSRIKIIHNVENIGLTASLNKGIAVAKGKYIARMDGDDISLPHRLEIQVKFLEKNPTYALIGSSYYKIDTEGNILSLVRVLTKDTEIRSGLKKQNWFGHGSVLIRKSAFVKCGGYNKEFEYAQDYDLWLRMAKSFSVANIEEPLYCWRTLANSITVTQAKKQAYYADLAVFFAGIEDVLVSVIIPTYNRPELLKIALSSVSNQTHKNFEVIVINDAGIDVKDIIAEFNTNNIITYIQHTENKGLASARNSGLSVARGKYISYLDDDDIFYPAHIEILISFLESSEYKVAYTDAIKIDQILKETGQYENINRGLYMSRDFSMEELLRNNISPVHCFMHEKSCVDKGLRFDTSMRVHEDYDFWMRMAREYAFKHIKKATVEYRHRTEGFVQLSRTPQFLQSRNDIINRMEREKILWGQRKTSRPLGTTIVDTIQEKPKSIADQKRIKQGRRRVYKESKT